MAQFDPSLATPVVPFDPTVAEPVGGEQERERLLAERARAEKEIERQKKEFDRLNRKPMTLRDFAGLLTSNLEETGQRLRDPRELANLGRRTASVGVPVATGMAGRAIGGAVGGVPGAVAGDVAGSTLGEGAMQLLGVSPRSNTQLALAGGVPLGAAGLGQAGYLGKQFLYKNFAGRPLANTVAGELGEQALTRGRESAPLLAALDASTVPVPTGRPAMTLQQAIIDASRGKTTAEAEAVRNALASPQNNFDQLFNAGQPIQTALETRDMAANINRMSELARREFQPGGTATAGRALRDVRRAAIAAVEETGQPAAEGYRIYNKEKQSEVLKQLFTKPHPLNAVENKLTQDRRFAAAFADDPAALDEVREIARKLEQFTASGGSGIMGRGIVGGLAALIPGTPAAKAVTAVVGASAPEIVGFLASRPRGREFLGRILQGSSGFDAPKLAASLQFARALAAEEQQ